jgi:hypothetical protein
LSTEIRCPGIGVLSVPVTIDFNESHPPSAITTITAARVASRRGKFMA